MRDAEVVVVPSQWYEGLPLVVLRSLAVGTPLLVSDLENLCEDVIADGVGWSFRMGDADSLAEQLAAIARQPDRSTELRGRARRTYLERYTPEVDLGRLERIYHEISGG